MRLNNHLSFRQCLCAWALGIAHSKCFHQSHLWQRALPWICGRHPEEFLPPPRVSDFCSVLVQSMGTETFHCPTLP